MIARKIHLWVTEVGGVALVEAAWSVLVIPITVTNVRFSYNFLKGQRFRSRKFKKSTLILLQGAGEKVSELKALLRYEFTTAVRFPVAPERIKISLDALTLRSDVVTNHRRDSDWRIPEKLFLVFVLFESAGIVIPDGGHICLFACRRCGVLLEQSATVARSGGRESPCTTVSSSGTRDSASSTRSSGSSTVASTD